MIRTDKIYNEPRPIFGHRRGCTWDSTKILTPDGETRGHYDTTWGRWIHFEYRGKWKKIALLHPAVDNDPSRDINLTSLLP